MVIITFYKHIIESLKKKFLSLLDPNTKLWSFSITDYELLHTRCVALKPNITIETIPKNVLKLCSQPKEEVDYSCLSSIEPKLVELLLPFQKEGVW